MQLVIVVLCLLAWLNHVVQCLAAGAWGLLLAGGIVFPVGIIHGVGLFFGWFHV